jgi:Tol biopolymer transport system component
MAAALASDPQRSVTTGYTILPGAVAHLSAEPRDTTVTVADFYSLRVDAEDRAGNVRNDGYLFIPITPEKVFVHPNGKVIGEDVGIGRIEVSSLSVADTVAATIVPEGAIAAVRTAGSGNPYRVRIVTVSLDGVDESVVLDSDLWSDAGLGWSPDGVTLAFALGLHDTNLFRWTEQGATPFLREPNHLQSLAFPRYSRDGAWVYFNGRPGHQTNRVDATMPRLRLLDVRTGAVDAIDVPGVTPRWSPDGSYIAFVTTRPGWGYLDDNRGMRANGFLATMSPNGGDQRVIPTGTKQWYPHFDISPDGVYIIAMSSDQLLEIVNVETGESFPLKYSEGLTLPTWKP